MPTKLPYVPKPCPQCPFRKDTMKGWLGGERMKEILNNSSFVCHKTAYGKDNDKRQCAGHMIIKGKENDFFRVADSLGLGLNLKGQDLVFETKEDCIKHHSF